MVNVLASLEAARQQGPAITRNVREAGPDNWLYHSVDFKTNAGGNRVDGYKSNLKLNIPKGARLKEDGRVRVKEGDELNYNVAQRHPLTQQMLRDLPYV